MITLDFSEFSDSAKLYYGQLCNSKKKNFLPAVLLWFFTGGLGLHLIYINNYNLTCWWVIFTVICVFFPPLFILWGLLLFLQVFFLFSWIEDRNIAICKECYQDTIVMFSIQPSTTTSINIKSDEEIPEGFYNSLNKYWNKPL